MEWSTVHKSIKIERASSYAESAEKKLSMSFALHDDTYGKARKNIRVFHWGEHTYPFISKLEKPTKKIREILKENLKLTPSEVQPSFILSCLMQKEDWKEVENAADRLLDKQ